MSPKPTGIMAIITVLVIIALLLIVCIAITDTVNQSAYDGLLVGLAILALVLLVQYALYVLWRRLDGAKRAEEIHVAVTTALRKASRSTDPATALSSLREARLCLENHGLVWDYSMERPRGFLVSQGFVTWSDPPNIAEFDAVEVQLKTLCDYWTVPPTDDCVSAFTALRQSLERESEHDYECWISHNWWNRPGRSSFAPWLWLVLPAAAILSILCYFQLVRVLSELILNIADFAFLAGSEGFVGFLASYFLFHLLSIIGLYLGGGTVRE